MKKLVFLLTAFLCFSSLNAAPFDYVESGTYGYFLDTRASEAFIRGYLICELDDGNTAVFMNTIFVDSGISVPSGVCVSEDENHELVYTDYPGVKMSKVQEREARQTLKDLTYFDSMYKQFGNKIGLETFAKGKLSECTVYYQYSNVFPLFKFIQISDDADFKEVNYMAYRFGKIKTLDSKGVQSFYDDDVIPSPKHENKEFKIPKKNSKKIELNGIKFKIDENWVQQELDGVESWWLQCDSIRDAQIMVEKLPDGMRPKTQAEKCRLLTFMIPRQEFLLPATLHVFSKGDTVYISYEIWQTNEAVTFCIVGIKEDVIINFSAFDYVYYQNQEYFKKILGL